MMGRREEESGNERAARGRAFRQLFKLRAPRPRQLLQLAVYVRENGELGVCKALGRLSSQGSILIAMIVETFFHHEVQIEISSRHLH
jgi:hypothetical protein